MLLRAILLFLFFAFLARAVWRLLEGVARGAAGHSPEGRRGAPASPVKMAQCPVCGTYVVPGKALTGLSHGQVLYFCSETCRGKHAA